MHMNEPTNKTVGYIERFYFIFTTLLWECFYITLGIFVVVILQSFAGLEMTVIFIYFI